ncbi:MAG: hypothetical protein ACLUKN_05050 [Bacilli bacterium]
MTKAHIWIARTAAERIYIRRPRLERRKTRQRQNFCMNGIVFADRTYSAKYFEVKDIPRYSNRRYRCS